MLCDFGLSILFFFSGIGYFSSQNSIGLSSSAGSDSIGSFFFSTFLSFGNRPIGGFSFGGGLILCCTAHNFNMIYYRSIDLSIVSRSKRSFVQNQKLISIDFSLSLYLSFPPVEKETLISQILSLSLSLSLTKDLMIET